MHDLEKKLSHKHPLLFGIAIIVLVFGILGGWASFAKMDLAVKAPGEVIVKTYSKSIKYTQGGIIDKLYVKEGDFVEKNQPLLKLDTKKFESQLNNNIKQYHHMLASKARIEAEINHKKTIDFPEEIPQNIKNEETNIFKNRLTNLNNQINDIKYQIKQQQQSIKSLEEMLKSKQYLLNSYNKELQKWENLFKQQLVDESKILDLQRKINQTKADIENIKNQIAQKKTLIEELKNKLKLIKSDYKKELFSRLKDINTKLPSIKSQISVLKDEINKSYLKAPSSGYVQNLKVHTPGEIISPYREIMQIIPKNNELIIEAKISPMDIDKVKAGEKAEIMFASYVDPSALPVKGVVTYVSADIIKDEKNPNMQYYKALIKITPEGMDAIKKNGFEIKPGMPVTVYIKAGKRTFISYLLYPMKQLLKGAFHAN